MGKHRFVFLIVTILLLCNGCWHRTELSNQPLPSALPKKQVQPQIKRTQQIQGIQPSKQAPSTIPKQLSIVPNKIMIPSVNIKSDVDPVGVLSDGQMDVPKSPERVGVWIGINPGQKGNAVIAGHVDNYTGPAVFYPLKKIKPGDPVIVSNDAGVYLVFKVTAIESYPASDAPLERIFGKANEERLNLITCTGKYNRQKKEHEKRLVVFTRLMK